MIYSTDISETDRFDQKVISYLPHRPPMLLVNRIIELSQSHAIAEILLDEQTPFMTDQGVPAVVGIEYMGQTAALIAGYQLEQGLTEPHLGFLLGTRSFSTQTAFFKAENSLIVECHEKALVGDSLATFDCLIKLANSAKQIASANLSVFRKSI